MFSSHPIAALGVRPAYRGGSGLRLCHWDLKDILVAFQSWTDVTLKPRLFL